jgi:hypothetical protein
MRDYIHFTRRDCSENEQFSQQQSTESSRNLPAVYWCLMYHLRAFMVATLLHCSCKMLASHDAVCTQKRSSPVAFSKCGAFCVRTARCIRPPKSGPSAPLTPGPQYLVGEFGKGRSAP